MSERPVVLPDNFSGEGSWSDWKYHFLNVAQINGWDDDAKLQWLRVRLVGRAQRTVRRISEDFSFVATINALDETFEPSSRQVQYQAELQSRAKRTTEGWGEYADDLRRLSERGFPDMPECAREQLALQVYFRQLHHPQVAFCVKQKRPATLDEAVATTIEIETYLPPKTAASITNEEPMTETDSAVIAPITTPSTDQSDREIGRTLEKIVKRLEALEAARIPAKKSTWEGITCFNCGKKGHIARNCRQYRQARLRQQQLGHEHKENLVRTTNYNDTLNYDANTTVSSYNGDAVSAICAGGYRVEGEVRGVRIKFLVDSGAAVTLMRKDVWERVSKKHPQKLCAYKSSGLVGVEGSSLTVHGCATVNLNLGNCEFETDVVVVSPLITHAILGVDFLQRHQACIHLPSQRLILTDQGDRFALTTTGTISTSRSST